MPVPHGIYFNRACGAVVVPPVFAVVNSAFHLHFWRCHVNTSQLFYPQPYYLPATKKNIWKFFYIILHYFLIGYIICVQVYRVPIRAKPPKGGDAKLKGLQRQRVLCQPAAGVYRYVYYPHWRAGFSCCGDTPREGIPALAAVCAGPRDYQSGTFRSKEYPR
jgi:hypothetical protein